MNASPLLAVGNMLQQLFSGY